MVVLRGYNMVYKRPPYAPDAIGFSDDDAAWLASEGYNNVRVGIIYAAVEPTPGVYDDAYLDRIRATVDTLARHGIVSMLDFHQDLYNERFQGEGWPDWAVYDDGLPAEPKSGFPTNYLVMPALWRAFDNFWANVPGPGGVGLQDRYAAAWAHVAARFSDHPHVFGYDLMNEPWPGTEYETCISTEGCPAFDAKMTEFYRRVVAAIRRADPRTLIYYEPNVIFNNGAKTNVGDVGDREIGFSFHSYCLQAAQTNENTGCDIWDDLVVDNAETHATETGAALMMSEWGATDSPSVLTAMANRLDRTMLSWQEWHYCGCDDPTTSGPGDKQAVVRDPAKPPQGDNLDAGKLAILTRPYPQLVAGTPTSWAYDAQAKRFELTFGTEAPGGKAFGAGSVSEVALPQRVFPDGYAAQVQGGRIVSKAGAGVLRIATCAGTDTVAVTVTAAGARKSSCDPPRLKAPKLLVDVTPARVQAGRRATVRVRVRSLAAGGRTAPLRRARVQVPGAQVRRTGKAGEASFRVRYERPGRRRVAVRAAGYARGNGSFRVIRRR